MPAPWQVSIKSSNYHVCSGIVINPRTVLTSAKCIVDVNSSLSVHAGSANYSDFANQQIRKVQESTVHEKYNESYHTNDIAVLILDAPLEITFQTQPLNLPKAGQVFPINTPVIFFGWDTNRQSQNSEILKSINLEIVDNEKTNQDFDRPMDGSRATNNMICTSNRNNLRGTCDVS